MIFQINFYFSIITKIKIKTGKFGPGNPLFLNAVEVSCCNSLFVYWVAVKGLLQFVCSRVAVVVAVVETTR
jgi:hypothetical protein